MRRHRAYVLSRWVIVIRYQPLIHFIKDSLNKFINGCIYVLTCHGRCFKKQAFVILCKTWRLQEIYFSFTADVFIHFIAKNQVRGFRSAILFCVVDPSLQVIKRILRSNIKTNYYTYASPKIASSDWLISFLTSSIPNLKFHCLLIHFNVFLSEFNTNCVFLIVIERLS